MVTTAATFRDVSHREDVRLPIAESLPNKKAFHTKKKEILDNISKNETVYELRYSYQDFYLFPVPIAEIILQNSGLDILTVSSKGFSEHESDYFKKIEDVKLGKAVVYITRGQLPQAVMIQQEKADELIMTHNRKTGKKLILVSSEKIKVSARTDWDKIIDAAVKAAVKRNCTIEVKSDSEGKPIVTITPLSPKAQKLPKPEIH
jgi:hypothetical protein